MSNAVNRLVVGSAVAAAGTAVAAIGATLCCAGPAVIAVLGASGAVAAAGLEPYRPYLLGASVVSLAFGFWRAYAPIRVRAGDGAVCPIRTGPAVRAVLWISAAVTVVSILIPRFLK